MKRAAVLLVVAAVVSGWLPALSGAATLPPASFPTAHSAVLMDAKAGTVLYARDADTPRPPASTTKVLTAILAIELLNPDAVVTISSRAATQRSGSAVGLEAGEQWRVRDLLHALMLISANDAAVALAEAAAGSVERFVGLMNRKARAIGARGSTFVVPHGLYHPRHLATARDLALITRYALRNPTFAQLVRLQTWTLERPGREARVLVNTNKLLWRMPGADGVKTGWVSQSGSCLIASATREGRQLIAVVLNSPNAFGDAAALLSYGFASTVLVRVALKGEVVARAAVPPVGALDAVVEDDVYVVVRRGVTPETWVRLRADLAPPIRQGERVGELLIFLGTRVLSRAPVVAAADVRGPSLWERLARAIRPERERRRRDAVTP